MGELKIQPAIGQPPSLEFCRLSELNVDASYQRSIENGGSQVLINRIASAWNWDLCHPLSVARREDGSCWVVDGQHRLTAALKRGGIDYLPCVIFKSAGTANEARNFAAMKRQRRNLSQLDIFKAGLVGGDPEVRLCADLIEKAGLKVGRHTNYTAARCGEVMAVGGVKQALREFGERKTAVALRIFAEAFGHEVQRYGGTIFPGIAGCVAKFWPVDEVLLTEILKLPQEDWRNAIHQTQAASALNWRVAAEHTICAAYAEALGED